MEHDKVIRYYLAGKQSWNDVTTMVNYKGLPKPGQVINVGKIKMMVKEILDGAVHGKPVIKIFLENMDMPYTSLDEAIELLEDPIFIELSESVNEAKGVKAGGYPGGETRIRTAKTSMGWSAPKTWANGPGATGTLGNAVRSQLSNIGAGYGVQVADFGEAVSVTITYSNPRTSRCASQSFILLWKGDNPLSKHNYKVYANSNRWRACDDYNQAISFIRSKATTLPSSANVFV